MARQTFHQELREIEESVIQMAALVEREVARAMQALSQPRSPGMDADYGGIRRNVRPYPFGQISKQSFCIRQ